MATKMDVEDLKSQWVADPIWDIESTEGFEEHYDELVAFREAKQIEWDRLRSEKIQGIAEKLNCSPELVVFIDGLIGRIDRLEERLSNR